MKPRSLRMLAGLATCCALIAGVSGASAATKTTATKHVTCTLKLYVHPQTKTKGFDLGFANCGKPFGHGLVFDTYRITSPGPPLREAGVAKQFFDEGSVHSAYKLTVMTSTATATGTFKLTGGTGVDQIPAANFAVDSPFFSIDPATYAQEPAFAAQLGYPVVSFDLRVLDNAKVGEYSLRVRTSAGENQ